MIYFMNTIKNILREICISLRLDLTKNLKYDRLTRKILKKELKKNHNCIDIGCHKGEILDLMLRYSPEGKHFAFEPIPSFFKELKIKYKDRSEVYPYALSDSAGETVFQFVKNAPAYSGIKKRRYDIENPEIEEITVEMKKLDDVLPLNERINFVKIDVEGAEFGVMKGAKKLLKQNKPTILFEFGKGASDYYGTTPADIYNFITEEVGLGIYTLNDFLFLKKSMNADEFAKYFDSNTEYYFVAANIS
jgi:FkbM family methyltransferase